MLKEFLNDGEISRDEADERQWRYRATQIDLAGKSHLAQAIGLAAVAQGYRVLYRKTHALLDEIAEATIDGARKPFMENLATIPPFDH